MNHQGRRLHSRRASAGQAVIELLLVLPLLLVLMSLGVDAGRFYSLDLAVHGAARAGAINALDNDKSDTEKEPLDQAIRESSGDLFNADWGGEAVGGSYVQNCAIGTPNDAAHLCGDPGGCADGDAFFASTSAQACFAIGYCLPDGSACGNWGLWPPGGSNDPIVIRVHATFTPLVGITGNIIGSKVGMTDNVYVLEQY